MDALVSGNFFLERQALEHSSYDYMILFASGLTFILPREAVLELAGGPWRVVQGGDGLSATGTLVPLEELMIYAI